MYKNGYLWYPFFMFLPKGRLFSLFFSTATAVPSPTSLQSALLRNPRIRPVSPSGRTPPTPDNTSPCPRQKESSEAIHVSSDSSSAMCVRFFHFRQQKDVGTQYSKRIYDDVFFIFSISIFPTSVSNFPIHFSISYILFKIE